MLMISMPPPGIARSTEDVMKISWIVVVGAGLLVACGDSASDGGTGGEGGSGATTTASATGTTGAGTTVAGGTTTAGTTAATTTAATTGAGGGGASHCPDAIHCGGVQGYFCYEVTGPDAAFDDLCENELFGQLGDGPCPETYSDAACLHDCAEPSVFVFARGIDQNECEMNGGTYVEDP